MFNRCSIMRAVLLVAISTTHGMFLNPAFAAEIKAGDRIVTTRDAPVKVGTVTHTTIPAGTELVAGSVRNEWVAVTVARDGKKIGGWIARTYLAPATSSGTTSGRVLAQVGQWTLTEDEFARQVDAIVKANNGEQKVLVSALGLLARTFVPPYVTEIDFGSVEGKTLYVQLLVNMETAAFEAESRGLHKDPDIAKDIRRAQIEILNFALLNEVLSKVTVTRVEIREFYETAYKTTLESIEQRNVRAIVVGSLTEANAIYAELLQGADFARTASGRSIAESAGKGGDLGYLVYQPNAYFQRFWEAVRILAKGEMSHVFKNPGKEEYYIVKVEDIKKGEAEPLDKISDQLEFLLKQKKSIEAIDKMLDDAKAKTVVAINRDLLD